MHHAGPVGRVDDEKAMARLIYELKPLVKKYSVFMLKLDPYIPYNDEVRKHFKKSGFKISKKHPKRDGLVQAPYSMVLDLNGKSQEEMLSYFSQKTRYNIKLSERKGIRVTYSNSDEYLNTFYNLFLVTTERDKFPSKSYDYLKDIVDSFDSDNLRIYIAWYEDEALASSIAINYGDEVYYLYGASSNEKRNLMPTYALQWEMIKWGIESKCKTYSFGGLASTDKTSGLYRFKEGFCRESGFTEYVGEFTKVYNYFFYLLYKIVYPLVVKINAIKIGFKIK